MITNKSVVGWREKRKEYRKVDRVGSMNLGRFLDGGE